MLFRVETSFKEQVSDTIEECIKNLQTPFSGIEKYVELQQNDLVILHPVTKHQNHTIYSFIFKKRFGYISIEHFENKSLEDFTLMNLYKKLCD